MLTKRLTRAGCVAITFFVMTAWPAGAQGQATSKEPPGVLYSSVSENPDPIWVSATQLTRGGGEIQWNLLGKNEAEEWQRTFPLLNRLETKEAGVEEVSKDNCAVNRVDSWPSVDRSIEDDFLALVATSREVFAGTVIAHTPGFLIGSPVTVLTVDVTESLRAEVPGHEHSTLYVAYPRAYFVMGGHVFCGKHQKGPDPPVVGSRILILSHWVHPNAGGSFMQVSVQEVFVAAEPGRLAVPLNLKDSAALQGVSSFDDLVEAVRRLLADAPELTSKSSPADDGGSR